MIYSLKERTLLEFVFFFLRLSFAANMARDMKALGSRLFRLECFSSGKQLN